MTGLPNPNFTYDELVQAKVGSPLSSEQNQCYAEIDENACTSDQLNAALLNASLRIGPPYALIAEGSDDE